jgi:hypothetical protein
MNLAQLDHIKLNFIVGSGRSGTTLLVYIFNQNPNCIASPEIKHFIHFYKKYKNVKKVSQTLINDYSKYLKIYAKNKKLFMHYGSETLLNKLKVGQEINYSRLTKLFFFCLTEEKQNINEINVIIDKNPYYTFYLKKITSFFPDAKIIFMLRDYRAFVLSNRQSQKKRVKILSIYYYSLVWNLFLKKALAVQKKHPTQLSFIKYEDLVYEKESTIKHIANYFDVVYSPEMLNFHETIRENLKRKKLSQIQYEWATKKIENLSKPLNSSRVEAWKKELTFSEIQSIEIICSRYGKLVGYKPITNEPSIILKIKTLILSLSAKTRLFIFHLVDNPKLKFYFDFKKNN